MMKDTELYYLSLFKEYLKYLYDDITQLGQLIKEMQEEIDHEKRLERDKKRVKNN